MPKRPLTPHDLHRIVLPGDPQFSPDGRRFVFPVKAVGEKHKTVSRLFDWCDGKVRQLTFGQVVDGPVRWRPDGTGFAFVSDRAKPFSQLYLMAADGGEAHPVSRLPEGSVGRFEWSPDGRMIAFLFRAKSPNRTAAAKKTREESGESEPPWEVDTLIWRMDGDGVFGGDRFELCVLDVEAGTHRSVLNSAADGEYAFCWTADSGSLLVAYNVSDRPSMEPWNEQMFVVDVETREQRAMSGYPAGNFGAFALQPGGGSVAMMYQDRSADHFGIKSTLLAVYDSVTGEFRVLTGPDVDVGVHTIGDCREAPEPRLVWSTDGKQVFASLSERGSTQIAAFDAASGSLSRITSVRGECLLGSVDPIGRIAACRLREDGFPEVALLDPNGRELWRSSFNEQLEGEVEIATPEEHWVESEPGVRIQTWVLQHPGAGSVRPAAIEIHGGPHGMYHSALFFEMQLLAAAGYVVVFSNIRGSTGYGEEFARCISGDWGVADWADVRAVTEFTKALPYTDSDRIGILGGSYGGYMVNWAISHSADYRAAITDRCVSNLLSKSGNSDYTFVPDGVWPGAAFDEWEHLWERSPVKHFKNVKTPTLVIHSEGDLRCHVEQGEQVYTFLQMLGVPSKLVRYPGNTSHGMSRNGPVDMRIHRLQEILAWFERYL